MSEIQTQRVCVSGFILNPEGKFLFVKRSDDDDFLAGFWELPGGGTDFGEDPVQAVVREVQEEVGMTVKMLFPAYVTSYVNEKNKNKQYVETFFVCKNIHNQEVTLSAEHSDYHWVTFEEAKTYQTTQYILNVLDYIERHMLSHPRLLES